MNRRGFLTALLAIPLAGIKPKPIPGTWGAVTRSTVPMWKSSYLYMGGRGGGKTAALSYQMLYSYANLTITNPSFYARIEGIGDE